MYGVGKGTNQAFTFGGKAYIVHANSNIYLGDQLSEYIPATGTWKKVLTLPFKSLGGSIISSPNGVYFGFGLDSAKSRNTNDWYELRFNAGVSDNVGTYETTSNGNCGTGDLDLNVTSSIYDEQGDLFLTIKSGGSISSLCAEVNSINLNQKFRTVTTNFGNGFVENGMFLNKSVLFKNDRGIGVPDVLRLYYTTTELNKLVQDFNALYNSNKTLQDVKLLQYNNYGSNDINPLNNAIPSGHILYNPTLQEYGTNKYFEITPRVSGSIGGEIYAVILSGETLGNNSFQNTKISIYPNPASAILTIQLSDNNIDKIVITDLTGKIILTKTENTYQVNVQNLAKGMYILQAFSGKEKFTSKFVKE